MIKLPDVVAEVNHYTDTGCITWLETPFKFRQELKLVTLESAKQAVRDAYEDAARVADCRDLPATAAAIRALIKEIPE